MGFSDWCDVSDMKGATLSVVRVGDHDEEIYFEAEDGRKWRMFHAQDCCESVSIDDIVGDVNDLVGAPLHLSEEFEREDPTAEESGNYHGESYTYTFYRFGTRKGFVTIRWYGTSNGYYSESVQFARCDDLDRREVY